MSYYKERMAELRPERKSPRSVSDADRQRIQAEHKNGASVADLAHKYEISRTTAWKIVNFL